MRVSVLFLAITLVASTAWTIEATNIRINPIKKLVTIEVDGQFPPGPQTDVLFVIDDSGSMSIHQENLAKHIQLLAGQALNVSNDFHIAVTNTFFGNSSQTFGKKKKEGQLFGDVRVIDPSTPNLVSAIQKNLLLGVDGSAEESIFRPVMTALSPEMITGENKDFYRQEASLSVVFLTDAREQSDVKAWAFADYLVDLKGDSSKVNMQAIMVSSDDIKNNTCLGESAKNPLQLEEAVRLLNGEVFSLCSQQMAQDIETLAKNVFPPFSGTFAPGVALDFIEMVGRPEKGTIKVQFGHQTLIEDPALGWSYDSNKNHITFGPQIQWEPQALNARIVITYKPQ